MRSHEGNRTVCWHCEVISNYCVPSNSDKGTMTGHLENASETPTPAQTVGNQFVSQYYTVLHSSPKHLYRFYSENSSMTHVDIVLEGGSVMQRMKHASGQKMIDDTLTSLHEKDITTDIFSVDSQYSLDGGVMVQVTGALQESGGIKRSFVQTFFLAVQEKGFYVLNDIFRYLLPSDELSETKQFSGTYASEHAVKSKSDSSSPPGITTPPDQVSPGRDSESGVDNAVSFQVGSGENGALVKEAQKPTETVLFREKIAEKQEGDQVSAVEETLSKLDVSNSQKPSSYLSTTTKGIFLRDIPAGVSADELQRALEAFGPLKPNSLSVKSAKGKGSYAFVDFLSVESAQACLNSGLVFQGARISLEPKRPTIIRHASGNGRRQKGNNQSTPRQGVRQVPPYPMTVQQYAGMQFPHSHMVLYPPGTIGVPVTMGMQMAQGMMPQMQQPPPPPPPPPQGINAYINPYDKPRSKQKKKSSEQRAEQNSE
ncbi:hypothetical protein M9435_004592 [Picochlorum sp. BPE23]|nr:hypothetical protein M9435_004592 [Picochlorum sp. BPE23]